MKAALLTACLSLLSAGCSSLFKTGPNELGRDDVTIRAETVPPGAKEIQTLRVTAQTDFQSAMEMFADRVVQIGGNFGKIDSVSTEYKTVMKYKRTSQVSGNVIRSTAKGREHDQRWITIAGRAYRTQ